MKFPIFFVIILILLAYPVNAFSIGAAPGVHYIGEFNPGDKEYIKFYLITNANGDVLTTVSFLNPHLELYYPDKLRYISAHQTSQEDISDWIVFQQNPVLVSPRKSQVVTLEGGELVKANAEVVYKLNIPDDAEPGYHVGSIALSPKIIGGGGKTGVSMIGLTRYLFIFKVAGEAKRGGEVKNIYANRVGENKARIDVIFKNTGENTMSVWIDNLNIYDEFGNLTKVLRSGLEYVAPGEVKILPVYWNDIDLDSGFYKTEVKLNYITGYATKTTTIEIPDIITVPPEIPQDSEFPWWIVLLAMLLVILIIYWKS